MENLFLHSAVNFLDLCYERPSNRDRLSVPIEVVNAAAPEHYLRTCCGQESLMSFCSTSYIPTNDCSFHCALLHIPVLPFPSALSLIPRTSQMFCLACTSPPKILLSIPTQGPSSSVLPHMPLPFPSIYFLSRTSLPSRTCHNVDPTLPIPKSS